MVREKYKYSNEFKEYIILLQRLEKAEIYFKNNEVDENSKAYKELGKILNRLNELYNYFLNKGIKLETNIKDYL